MSSSIKDFLNKFFDLGRKCEGKIPPNKISEFLRDYKERLVG